MALYLDILDSSGARVGTGPIPILSWESTKRLSRAGTWQAEVPAQEQRLVYATSKRRVRCYAFENSGVRVIGEGIIDERQTKIGRNGTSVVIGGDDLLSELGYRLVFTELSVVTSYTPHCGFVVDGTWFFWEGDEESPEMLIEEQDSYLYVGLGATTFNRIDFNMDLTNVVSTTLNLGVSDERGGGLYRQPEDVTDTTENAGAPLGQDGYISFTRPASWFKRDLEDEGATAGEGELYWVRFDPEAAMGRDDPDEPTLGIRIDGIVVKSITPRLDDISYLLTFAPSGWTLNSAYYTTTADGTLKKIDGESLLAVLVAISEQTGEQFRLGAGRVLEWLRGLQQHSGLVALQAFGMPMGIEEAFSDFVIDPPVMPTAPDAPTGLTVAPTGTNRAHVVLNWNDNSDDETGFIVEYSTDNATWSELITTAADIETYTHTTPTYGQVWHYYRIRAENETGESANATAQLPGILLNLLSAWELENTSYTDSVSGYNGTASGGTTSIVTGKIGNGVSVASNAKISVASNSALQGGDTDWAVATWAKIVNTNLTVFLGKDAYDVGGGREWLLLQNGSGRLWLDVYDGSTNPAASVTDTVATLSTGTWYHLVGYHSATNNEVGVRVNGGAFTTAATTGTAGTNAAEFALVGRQTNSALADGERDQVLWWKGRVPSVAEFNFLYNSGSGLSYPFS